MLSIYIRAVIQDLDHVFRPILGTFYCPFPNVIMPLTFNWIRIRFEWTFNDSFTCLLDCLLIKVQSPPRPLEVIAEKPLQLALLVVQSRVEVIFCRLIKRE